MPRAEKRSQILVAEGEKESAILRADAVREQKIKEAEGEAEAILKIYEAQAKGIRMINDAKPTKEYITLQSFDALAKGCRRQGYKDYCSKRIAKPCKHCNIFKRNYKR